jgi:4'-phosphopantetheinyl transferase
MAVVASVPVGCDVESTLRPVHPALSRRAFSPADCDRLFALPEPARPAEFFRLWTLKEASLKALGIGFRTNPAPAALARVSARTVPAPAPYTAAVALLSP